MSKSSSQIETSVTVAAEVIELDDNSVPEISTSRNDAQEDDSSMMITKLSVEQLNDTFVHLLQNNIKHEHRSFFTVTGGALSNFGKSGRNVSVVFQRDRCVETTLTAAKKSVHRGQQDARITKGVVGWKNHNVLVYHIPARVYHGNPLVGQECSHICNNQNCINPWHLEWVIRQLNITRYSCSLAAKSARRWNLTKPAICFHDPICVDCIPCENARAIRNEIIAEFDRERLRRRQLEASTSSATADTKKRKIDNDAQ